MMVRLIGVLAAVTAVGLGVAVTVRADRAETRIQTQWPPVGKFVQVDGTPVHYVQKGIGPDVVLIHGAGGNLRDFTFDLVGKLAPHYRVTAFDRPGLGYTGRASKDLGGAFTGAGESPQVQAALLARAASLLEIERPIVVGHSFGGAVAMAWALDHDAAAVVGLGGAIMPWPGAIDLQYRILGSSLGGALLPPLATAFVPADRTGSILEGIFAPQTVPENYADHMGAGLALRRDTIRANGRQVFALRPNLAEMAQRYPELDLPVELLHGDRDRIVGLDIHARGAAAVLPDAQVTVLPGVGHMPQHAEPDAVVEAVHRAAQRAGLR